jgi:hypothetical protein
VPCWEFRSKDHFEKCPKWFKVAPAADQNRIFAAKTAVGLARIAAGGSADQLPVTSYRLPVASKNHRISCQLPVASCQLKTSSSTFPASTDNQQLTTDN